MRFCADADCLLKNLDVAGAADDVLARLCVMGSEADEARCRAHVENSDRGGDGAGPALGTSARARRRGGARTGEDAARDGCGDGMDERGGVRRGRLGAERGVPAGKPGRKDAAQRDAATPGDAAEETLK